MNQREAEQIVIALRDRGFPVEYILAPDEGHGFARPINNLALFMESEKFLAAHLGGRFQEGGSPESVARLKEITVDPKTVVLTKKVDAAAVGLPKPAVDLQPGTYPYQVTIAMGEQKMSLKVSIVDYRWRCIVDGGQQDGDAGRHGDRHGDHREDYADPAKTEHDAGAGGHRPGFCRR